MLRLSERTLMRGLSHTLVPRLGPIEDDQNER